jgi:hypothetical protein
VIVRALDVAVAGVIACSAATLAAQQTVAPEQLVAQLRGDGRATAHSQLVALGATAVPALTKGLVAAQPDEVTDERLCILREIGPAAGDAVPAILDLLRRVVDYAAACDVLGELAPYGPDGSRQEWESLQLHMHRLMLKPQDTTRIQRTRERFAVPQRTDVAKLTQMLRTHHAYTVEVAAELLGRRATAAHSALPALTALLELPDPRILLTDETVPLRACAARAILAIATDGPAAERARAVLAGAPPARAEPPPLPERARQRARELVAQLANPAQRAAAIANLEALGSWVVPDVAQAVLSNGRDADEARGAACDAALALLARFGPRAADATPELFEALTTVRAEHTAEVIGALTEVAPWSRDVVPPLGFECSIGSLTFFGKPIEGTIDAALLTEVNAVEQRFWVAMELDPLCEVADLERSLIERSPLLRERALRIATGRPADARPLLPAFAAMLDAEQPPWQLVTWEGNGVTVRQESHTALIHRLAAEAILAIAAPDDPLVERARGALPAAGDKK